MAGTPTKRGILRQEQAWRQGATPPAQFFVALVTAAVTPTVDTALLGSLTEIAVGNGYVAGGYAVPRSATGWPSVSVVGSLIQSVLKDIAVTAAGGPIPASGAGARWAVLTDANGTLANREVFEIYDLGSPVTVSDGQTATLSDMIVESSPV